jgi:bifunctional non-homologous end joining protein LigD
MPVADVAGARISSPTRVLYPALGFTKLDLARLYADLADWAVPHLENRPLTLVRCEHGASTSDALRTQCQFLKHSAGWHRWVSPVVRRVNIREQKKIGEYLVIDSPRGLLALMNGDILELHTWNAKADRIEQPDRLVFDLDPGPAAPWLQLLRAAVLIRERLATYGLESWIKTTGGNGLHVVVPLEPRAGWDTCAAFSRALADAVVREDPRAFTLSYGKAGRGAKILIDYKRNYRTSVTVAAFSTRARPQGTLSIPVAWSDLDPQRPPEPCSVLDVRERVAAWPDDPWRAYWSTRQRLPRNL